MNHLMILALCAVMLAGFTQSLPGGAPTSICQSLLPVHPGFQAMTTASPFSIIPSATAVNQGNTIHVEIRSNPPELTFGGFMIHAVDESDRVIGHFLPYPQDGVVHMIECGEKESTATHTSPAPKQSGLSLEWQAPENFLGHVTFKATVAQGFGQFWVAILSDSVNVLGAGVELPPSGGSQTSRPPASTASPTYSPPETIDDDTPADPIYTGCGTTKTCFGFPDNCVDGRRCNAVGSVTVRGDRYEFEMKSGFNSPAYVAIALSMDDKMGDDSVMECVPEQGVVRAYTSWTSGAPNYGVTREQVPQNIIRTLESSNVDGTIYCRIERDSLSTVKGRSFDLVNDKFHLLIATGGSVEANSVGYHTIGRIASGEPRSLAEVGEFAGKSKVLLRLHGAFMMVSWIGTASVGIFLARYFKQTWVGSSLCGKDQWFAWHRTFMVITWSLTVAGFIIIFVELGSWSAERNPHAILGTVTTVLCFIQPFGAMLRPAPTHRNRPLFNWLHWLVGNLAHILAIVTIFFAKHLTKAELPIEWFDWVLVAFVAFHVFMHIVMSIAGCVSDRSHQQRINTFPMSDITPSRGGHKDRKMDAPYSGLRKGFLGIYLIVVLLFVIAFIVIVVLAPINQTFNDLRTKLAN